MSQELRQKYQQLLDYLKKTGRVAIAFSGGVDSTFLLKAASEALPVDHIIALTIDSPYIPHREIEEAGKTAGAMNIRHIIVESIIYTKRSDIQYVKFYTRYAYHVNIAVRIQIRLNTGEL